MKTLAVIVTVAAALATGIPVNAQQVAEAQSLSIVLDKTANLSLKRPAAAVVVGQAGIADVTVATPRRIILIGKKVGETSLTVLDDDGHTLVDLPLTVVPEVERHVTIHKGSDGVLTLSCNPRCTGVDNPGIAEAPSGGAESSVMVGGSSLSAGSASAAVEAAIAQSSDDTPDGPIPSE